MTSDQSIVRQPRDKETRGARRCVRIRAVESLVHQLRRVALSEEQIGSRVDKEVDALLSGRITDYGNSAHLSINRVESPALNDPVFEIDSDDICDEKLRDVFA